MTHQLSPEQRRYISAQELAVRWHITYRTALNKTRTVGFPAPLPLSGRTMRWPLDEVDAWEQKRRGQHTRARHVTTGTLPPAPREGAPGPGARPHHRKERRLMARTSKKQVREILETAHGVVLYPPTDVNPYYRIVYRDSNGKRIPRSAGRDGDAAWAKACAIDAELAAAVTPAGYKTVADLRDAFLTDMATDWAPRHEQDTRKTAKRDHGRRHGHRAHYIEPRFIPSAEDCRLGVPGHQVGSSEPA